MRAPCMHIVTHKCMHARGCALLFQAHQVVPKKTMVPAHALFTASGGVPFNPPGSSITTSSWRDCRTQLANRGLTEKRGNRMFVDRDDPVVIGIIREYAQKQKVYVQKQKQTDDVLLAMSQAAAETKEAAAAAKESAAAAGESAAEAKEAAAAAGESAAAARKCLNDICQKLSDLIPSGAKSIPENAQALMDELLASEAALAAAVPALLDDNSDYCSSPLNDSEKLALVMTGCDDIESCSGDFDASLDFDADSDGIESNAFATDSETDDSESVASEPEPDALWESLPILSEALQAKLSRLGNEQPQPQQQQRRIAPVPVPVQKAKKSRLV